MRLATRSKDRFDYIQHPESGEQLADRSLQAVRALKRQHAGRYNVQIVASDGLNALAIAEPGHLDAFLKEMRRLLRRCQIHLR